MRADALRNHTQILATSRRLMGLHGINVGMEEIAQAAGVAVGTLYRHHPTKADLVQAVLQECLDEMVVAFDAAHDEIAAGARPLEAMASALDETTQRAWADRALKRAVERSGASVGPDALGPVVQALGRLFDAAQRDGSLRPEVDVDDLALMMQCLPPNDAADSARRRWLHLILRSLATPPGIDRIDTFFADV